MPPIQAEASSSTAGGAEVGKDRLWEFQLRRENKSILQEIRSVAKHRELDQVEFARQTKAASDRLFALESRVAELEHARKEDEKAREKWMDDAAAFKSSMADFLSGRLSEDEVRFIINGGSNPVHSVPTTPTRSPLIDRRPPAPRSGRSANPEERNVPSAEDDFFRRPAPGPIQKHQAKQSNSRRPATRSRARAEPPSGSSRPVDATPVISLGSRIPHFSQGSDTTKNYFANANAVFQSTPNSDNDPRFDIDFVNSFLRGMTGKKAREKVVDELRQLHPSRVKKDGWVEVLCEWDDVEHGLRRAGLLTESEKKGSSVNKRNGRFINPRTMVETDF